jgi:hypothetical protein
MSERQVVTIMSFGDVPKGEWPHLEAGEIKRLLENTNPYAVEIAGLTYHDAASKIKNAVKVLEEHAPKIAEIWKGPDANRARHALEMLHATGNELSTKLKLMGGALQSYAGELLTAKAKADEEVTVPGAGQMTQAEEDAVREGLEKVKAQRALYELNKQIVGIYNIEVPRDVSYELPTVVIPDGPPETRDLPGYPTGSTTKSPTFRPVSDDGGGSGSSGGGSGGSGGGSGGPNPGGADPGGPNPGGPDPGGPNPGGSDPGGSNPGGSDPTDPGTTDPDAPNTPGPGQSPNPGTGDGTVPPVIGDQNRTTTDGPNAADPRQTDMASFQPQPPGTTFTAPTTAPTTTISPPSGYTLPGPMGASPGVPSTIGSPGLIGGQSSLAGAGGLRGAGGMPAGTPFMPFMGGGGAAGEHGDLERNTYMPEDASAWTTNHETTDPVIG